MNEFKIKESVDLYRIGEEIAHFYYGTDLKAIQNEYQKGMKTTYMASVQVFDYEEQYYQIHIRNRTQNKTPMGLVVASLKGEDGRSQRGYVLSAGDEIMFGRVVYSVTEIQTHKDAKVQRSFGSNITGTQFDVTDQKIPLYNKDHTKNEIMCRICYDKENTSTPTDISVKLINICKCKGSTGLLHFACWKKWMSSKLDLNKKPNSKTFKFGLFECEICKTPLPISVINESRRFDLIDIRPSAGVPYLLLEEKSNPGNTTSKPSLTIMEVNKDGIEFDIGRESKCDLAIEDLSVSRKHAIIKYDKNQRVFRIEDANSKFGTSIVQPTDYIISSNSSESVQIGRTVLTFRISPATADDNKT